MLEILKKKIDKSVATVSIKSNEFVEITKLKTQNATLEKEMDADKKQLGAAYYLQWKSGNVEEPGLVELCNAIEERENKIEENCLKIEELQKNNEKILGGENTGSKVICACGASNSASAKFCSKCGSRIEEKAQEGMKQCICGNMVKETAKFCPKCGNRFELEEDCLTEEINVGEN